MGTGEMGGRGYVTRIHEVQGFGGREGGWGQQVSWCPVFVALPAQATQSRTHMGQVDQTEWCRLLCKGACMVLHGAHLRLHVSFAHAMMQDSWANRTVPEQEQNPSRSASPGEAPLWRQIRHSGSVLSWCPRLLSFPARLTVEVPAASLGVRSAFCILASNAHSTSFNKILLLQRKNRGTADGSMEQVERYAVRSPRRTGSR